MNDSPLDPLPSPDLRRTILAAETFFSAAVCVLAFLYGTFVVPAKFLSESKIGDFSDTFLLFVAQDQAIAVTYAMALLFSIPLFHLSSNSRFRSMISGAGISRIAIPLLCIVAFLLAWLGRVWASHSFDLSLDEFFSAFQARIFMRGKLLAELPLTQFQNSELLQPFFVYRDAQHHLWASYYRPVFAAFRALFGFFNGDNFLNPAFAALSIWAIADITKRIFPDLPEAPILSSLLLLLSPQFLMTAASGFAFSAHLALNLLWLTLFLRGSLRAHILASVVGFLAIGLHQVVFHPLFAAPFLGALLLGRFGPRTALIPYAVSYSVALPLWVMWPEVSVWLQTGDASVLPERLSDVDYFRNYISFSSANASGLADIALALTLTNIFRFILWLSPAVLPLSVAAFLRWRKIGIVPILCGLSMVLSVAGTQYLMPNEIHSWGARYFHPVLGCLVLFAVAGYSAVKQEVENSSHRAALVFLLIASAVILLPWRAEQVDEKVEPRAKVQTAIEALNSDYVVLSGRIWFGSDFVRNDPFLRNHPLIVRSDNEEVPSAFAGKKVIVLTQRDLVRMGLPSGTSLEPLK